MLKTYYVYYCNSELNRNYITNISQLSKYVNKYNFSGFLQNIVILSHIA